MLPSFSSLNLKSCFPNPQNRVVADHNTEIPKETKETKQLKKPSLSQNSMRQNVQKSKENGISPKRLLLVEQALEQAWQDETFLKETSMREQIHYLHYKLHHSTRNIQMLYGASKSTIDTHTRRRIGELKNGKPPKISKDVDNKIDKWLVTCKRKGIACTVTGILRYLSQKVPDIEISRRGLIKHMKKLKIGLKKATAEDLDRISINPENIVDNFKELKKFDNIPTALCVNIDEMGSNDWADRKDLYIFQSNEDKTTPNHGCSRSSKHSTAIVGICADGTTLPFGIVINQKQFFCEAKEKFPDCFVYYTNNGFVNKYIFKHWMAQIIKVIVKKRTELGLDGSWGLITMDNFSGHLDEELLGWLEANQIKLHTYCPHSSHLTQPLDLCFFGAVKKHSNAAKSLVRKSAPTKEITTMFSEVEQEDESDQEVNDAFNEFIEDPEDVEIMKSFAMEDEAINKVLNGNKRSPNGRQISLKISSLLKTLSDRSTIGTVVASFERSGIVVREVDGIKRIRIDPNRAARFVKEYTSIATRTDILEMSEIPNEPVLIGTVDEKVVEVPNLLSTLVATITKGVEAIENICCSEEMRQSVILIQNEIQKLTEFKERYNPSEKSLEPVKFYLDQDKRRYFVSSKHGDDITFSRRWFERMDGVNVTVVQPDCPITPIQNIPGSSQQNEQRGRRTSRRGRAPSNNRRMDTNSISNAGQETSIHNTQQVELRPPRLDSFQHDGSGTTSFQPTFFSPQFFPHSELQQRGGMLSQHPTHQLQLRLVLDDQGVDEEHHN